MTDQEPSVRRDSPSDILTPSLVARAMDLDAAEKGTYLVLMIFANWSTGEKCYPAMKTLCGLLGATEKTVRGYLRSLEAKGYLTIEARYVAAETADGAEGGRRQTSNSYVLHCLSKSARIKQEALPLESDRGRGEKAIPGEGGETTYEPIHRRTYSSLSDDKDRVPTATRKVPGTGKTKPTKATIPREVIAPLFEALCTYYGMSWQTLPVSTRGRFNQAAAEMARCGCDVVEVKKIFDTFRNRKPWAEWGNPLTVIAELPMLRNGSGKAASASERARRVDGSPVAQVSAARLAKAESRAVRGRE